MPWYVMQPGRTEPVERFESPCAANRALLIFAAHELKNGRKADYYIKPPIDLEPDILRLDLPDWALEALRKEGV